MNNAEDNIEPDSILLTKTDVNENQKTTKADVVTEDDFRNSYKYIRQEKQNVCKQCLKSCHCRPLSIFPILQWLPHYNVKQDLVADLIAGVTVAVIHIPQGLAYALLAGVTPIAGIYMSVFPVFIYVLMGTSRHISTGPFAVLCMMVGNTISTYVGEPHNYTDIQVATATAFMIGLWQAAIGLLRLGFLSVLFSETLVSGFTTGVAIHVATSQVKSLLGLKIKSYYGPLKIIFMYYEIFANIESCNWVTVVMSASFIVVLVSFNEWIKPWLSKHCSVPVPIELLAIISGALISFFLNLKAKGLVVVGYVPTGLPTPTPPPFELLPNILVETFIYAVVALAMNLSLCKMYARKYNYDIDANQELLAYGSGNIFGSFFSCLPFASSLSRSAIQLAAGGRTQLTSLVSCILLVFVLLFAGPLFDPVPHCVLAAIIVVALKNMFLQVLDFPKIYKISKVEGLIWMSTFLSVVFLDLDYGLGVGMAVIILVMLVKSQIPQVNVLGRVPESDMYLELKSFKSAVPLPNITILQLSGNINFANCDRIRENILSKITKAAVVLDNDNAQYTVILDFKSIAFVDPAGVKSLLSICNKLKQNKWQLLLCQCRVQVYNTLQHCKLFDSFPSQQVFPTIQDAVAFCNKELHRNDEQVDPNDKEPGDKS